MKLPQIISAIILGWGAAFGSPAAAQISPSSPAVVLPPVPPPAKSPVDFFRELLAMPAAQRRNALTNRPPEWQRQILAKVSEYEALSPNQRELRLKVTELRYYLWPLMSMPATNRSASLQVIPEEMRQLVTERLEQWDKLSPSVQKDIRNEEATIRYFTQMQGATSPQGNGVENLVPRRGQELEARMALWRALPPARRQEAFEHFNRFFGLSEQEKVRALSSLSVAERERIVKTIDSFGRLSDHDRARCIRGLAQFTGMSVEDRLRFLRNAESWRAMSPDQRDAWTRLVNKYSMQPPLPPGLGNPPMPPMPRPAPPPRTIATNGN